MQKFEGLIILKSTYNKGLKSILVNFQQKVSQGGITDYKSQQYLEFVQNREILPQFWITPSTGAYRVVI